MRLIDADALIDDLIERYCKECKKRRGIKNGKYRIIYEIGGAPCRACEVDDAKAELEDAPTAEQTILGYPIEHLMLIAEVMRKENVTPEKVLEILMDVGHVAEIVRAEFEEQFRKAVERCWTN